jgi:hypothetical protein
MGVCWVYITVCAGAGDGIDGAARLDGVVDLRASSCGCA